MSFAVVLLASCGSSDKYGLKRLEGKWQANVQGTDWVESWTKSESPDVLLTGSGKEMRYGGEKAVEEMSIAMKNNVLTYSVIASGQNNDSAVDFALSASTEKSLKFENASHDFPQFIIYEFVDADHIVARIGTLGNEGTDKEFVFDFQRIP